MTHFVTKCLNCLQHYHRLVWGWAEISKEFTYLSLSRMKPFCTCMKFTRHLIMNEHPIVLFWSTVLWDERDYRVQKLETVSEFILYPSAVCALLWLAVMWLLWSLSHSTTERQFFFACPPIAHRSSSIRSSSSSEMIISHDKSLYENIYDCSK